MAEPATITAAIPTFNRRALLERAAASVLAETRVPIRLSVSDNASSDDTFEFMSSLAARDPRVAYTRNATNLGGLRNIANALAAVRTDYFVPLADDDLLLPDFLHQAYQIMESQPALGAAVFGTEARESDGRLVHVYPDYLATAPAGRIDPAEHMRLWLRQGHCAWSSVLWRTTVLDRTGIPYARIGLPGDVDFQAQVFAAFPAFLVNRPGAVYCMHDAQASRGFDLTHLPDWAAVFANLDRAAASLARKRASGADESGLEWGEYLELRQVAWSRLRFVWNRPTQTVLPADQRRRLALVAGFRLGDWPLASMLAEDDGTQSIETGADPRLFSLPAPDIAQPGRLLHGGSRPLLLAIVRWFADSSARERESATRLAQAQDACSSFESLAASAEAGRQDALSALGALQSELAARQEREAALLTEIELLQQRCQREESRYLSQRTRRLLARLARIRPPHASSASQDGS